MLKYLKQQTTLTLWYRKQCNVLTRSSHCIDCIIAIDPKSNRLAHLNLWYRKQSSDWQDLSDCRSRLTWRWRGPWSGWRRSRPRCRSSGSCSSGSRWRTSSGWRPPGWPGAPPPPCPASPPRPGRPPPPPPPLCTPLIIVIAMIQETRLLVQAPPPRSQGLCRIKIIPNISIMENRLCLIPPLYLSRPC